MLDFEPLGQRVVPLALSYLAWWVYVFVALIRVSADVCHAQGMFSLPPVLSAKVFRGFALVYDLIDFVADSFRLASPTRKILASLENLVLSFADTVIVVDERKQQIDSGYVRSLAVVNNCPVDRFGQGRSTLGTAPFNVYYGGALYEERGLPILFSAVRDLDGVEVVVAGTGPYEEEVRRTALVQPNVKYKGLLTEEESLQMVRSASIVFVFYNPAIPINRKAVPAKLYEAMMCGTPVLANTESSLVSEIVSAENCGVMVPYGDVPLLRSAILGLRNDPSNLAVMSQNGRKAFEREFNWTTMERRLINTYDRVLARALRRRDNPRRQREDLL